MNIRVHVKNALESRVVQEKAFELGYEWLSLEYNNVKEFEGDSDVYLFIRENRSITYSRTGEQVLGKVEFISFPTFVTRYIDKLPEKWAIEVKEEYLEELRKVMDTDTFMIINNLSSFHGYLHLSDNWLYGYWSNKLNEGFTEITIEQFRHLYKFVPQWGMDLGEPALTDKTITYTVSSFSDKVNIFDHSSLLSLPFSELISLRDYYREEINTNKAHLGVVKNLSRRLPTEGNKQTLSEAETLNNALQEEMKEVEKAIKGFIIKLKR